MVTGKTIRKALGRPQNLLLNGRRCEANRNNCFVLKKETLLSTFYFIRAPWGHLHNKRMFFP